ncbi:MAG: GcrA family cell cycle regulator [Rickettsiales bacterium]|jgi:GcrA cell cycle regulator|nr:GcrA family cell cycle regulator [Rickettsiales bacterium]
MATANSWTAAMVSQLKTLFNKGLSTAAIGKKLGVTKNAVVGKINRMGLNAAEKSAAPRKKAAPAPKIQAMAKKAAKSKSACKIHHNAAMMALEQDQCRWPMGDPDSDQFHFCGAKCFSGKPYCFEHCKIAYQFAPLAKRK